MAIRASNPDPKELEALKSLFSGSGGSKGGANVYMGLKPASAGSRGRFMSEAAQAQLARRKVDDWATEEDAMKVFYNMTEKARGDLTGKFVMAGILPFGAGVAETEAEWKKMVQLSARFGQAGQKVSPFDLLSGYLKAAGGASKNAWQQKGAFEVNVVTGAMRYAGPGVYLGNGKAMQTDTRIDLTDPDTAKALATKLFQDMMGRDPGAGELGAFASALSAAEAASPVTQSTTTTYDMETGQPVSQDTTSSGGVSAEGKAYIGEQQIKKKKEYGVNQAVTTYQGALENLVFGSPG